MYTSDIDAGRKHVLKHAAAALTATLFFACSGAVYEHFSYGVYSYYTIYAFAFPLLAGILLVFAAMRRIQPSSRTLFLLHACWAALAVGSMAAGAIQISGREHKLLIVYPVLGALLCILTCISYRRDAKSA